MIELIGPLLRRVELGALRYPPGSILPGGSELENAQLSEMLSALVCAVKVATEHPELICICVGHASPDGSNSQNLELSRARARLIAALLADDPEDWEQVSADFFTQADIARCVGFASEQCGWDCQSSATPPSSAELSRGVRAFQAGYNRDFDAPEISVDGDCGPQTRRAIFDVIRDALLSALEMLSLEPEAMRFDDGMRYFGAGSRYGAENWKQAELRGCAEGRCTDIVFIDPDELGDCQEFPAQQAYGDPPVRRRTHPRAGCGPGSIEIEIERNFFSEPLQFDAVFCVTREGKADDIRGLREEDVEVDTDRGMVCVRLRGLEYGVYSVHLLQSGVRHCVLPKVSVHPGGSTALGIEEDALEKISALPESEFNDEHHHDMLDSVDADDPHLDCEC